MTLILNVTTRLYVKNTETPGSGFIATAVLGNFTVVNTTADITLDGDSRGTGFLGYMEQNGTGPWFEFASCGSDPCHKDENHNMTFVNYTGRSDVVGQHGTGNVAGKVNYYAHVNLINITVMGMASASDRPVKDKEPRCEGIIIGHIFGAKTATMINVSVPQARVLSQQFNVGVQGLLMGAYGSITVVLKNWVVGYAERVFIQGYPISENGGIGTLFAYAQNGYYEVKNIVMHTRYANKAGTVGSSNIPKVIGGICGLVDSATLRITNVTMDFLSTYIINAGLIAGQQMAGGIIFISGVKSEGNKKYASSKTANLYRCVYDSGLMNLTITDYNTIPQTGVHLTGVHTFTCRYVWMLPFAQASYNNIQTMISPEQTANFACNDNT